MPETDPISNMGGLNPFGDQTEDTSVASEDPIFGESEGLDGTSGMMGAPADYMGGMGGGDMFGGLDDASGQSSEASSVESGKKPVVIIAHGIGANGMTTAALARQFEEAGYHVETPTSMTPFDGSSTVDTYNRLEAQNNPELDLDNVVLVGHSAGGAGVQQASTELGDNVAGVITIDGAPSMSTNTEVPHANFSHSGDLLGPMVGNPNPAVSPELQSDETLPGDHMTAMTGTDADNYVEAADQMLGR
jgi:pimeloyl-ACP methyl ester carboxylesterase